MSFWDKIVFTNTKTAAAKIEEPFQQSSQRNCSAACLKMVLKYYGVDKDETALADLIGIDRQGAEGDKIVKAAKKLNFEAERVQITESVNI